MNTNKKVVFKFAPQTLPKKQKTHENLGIIFGLLKIVTGGFIH